MRLFVYLHIVTSIATLVVPIRGVIPVIPMLHNNHVFDLLTRVTTHKNNCSATKPNVTKNSVSYEGSKRACLCILGTYLLMVVYEARHLSI
ncbi:hypothetical protein F5B19DRAFT_471782 [Rostrohypoxylon terebratum]|nr:hypothetical protein F5B19DRAFT_471782 [Rostrohypoxylon terebratum]